MQFFSIERIQQSSTHLANFNSGWVIVPFVLAANGVNATGPTNLSTSLGTDTFLDRYFNGYLIGIGASSGANAMRPRFKEILKTFEREQVEGDYAIVQQTKLWANAYSSRGYREMVGRGFLVSATASTYRLSPTFQAEFEAKLPATFKFEELLVWLFAFSGFPDGIAGWDALYAHLISTLSGPFAPEFMTRFVVRKSPPVAWPTGILTARPSNQDFQNGLMPKWVSLTAKASTTTAATATATAGAAAPTIDPSDPVFQQVQDLMEYAGARNFLFYGPPGTGKTHYAHAIAEALGEGDPSRVRRVQMHPSFSYDDFVEGYGPTTSGLSVAYHPVDRHLVLIADAARTTPDKTYVLVVDEISRGDPARVFGDTLTYIDSDYRGRSFQLSYSSKVFSIPDNLIIIGTTNPYDRSVTEMDDAFIRRFEMIEFAPSADVLRKHFSDRAITGDYVERVVRLFEQLNTVMPHGFGHSHFFRLEGPEQLLSAWSTKMRFLVARTLQFDPEGLASVDAVVEELFPASKPEAADGAVVAEASAPQV